MSNTVSFNRRTGNVRCDIITAREFVNCKEVRTASINNKLGTDVNGVMLCNSKIESDSMVVGGFDLNASKITYLTQKDFDSGTYRIKESGILVLKEDIVFDPILSKERADKPPIGWFAAITIECENWILDLNGFSISVSQSFLDGHINKVFSIIEMSNSPFPGVPFPVFTLSYAGETEFKRAQRGWIRNGKLGRSSHHGIHGNGNAEIQISGMTISDHEVTAITLNSPYNVDIRNCTINGNRHVITNRSRTAQLQTLLTSLERYSEEPGAAAHIAAMQAALDAELLSRTQNPITVPDGNTYGISIGASPASGGPRFNDAECANVPDLGYQRLPANVCIRNCTINDIRGAPNQQVCLVGDIAVSPYGGAVPAPFEQQMVTNHAGAFGALQWDDFYPSGSFAPNTVAKAQTYLLQRRRLELAIPDSDDYFLPEGFETNILGGSPNEATFQSHAKPAFGFDIAHVNKGAFGIKMGCVTNGRIENCEITNVHNTAVASQLRADIANGGFYNDANVGLDARYTGNDAFGVSLENCHDCVVSSSRGVNIKSDNGYSHGLSIFGESKTNRVINCDFQSVEHVADPVTPVDANPIGKSFGVTIDASTGNRVEGVHVRNAFGPRQVCGFAMAAGCPHNQFVNNMAHGSHADAAVAAGKQKSVSGFLMESTTSLQGCASENNYIDGESGEGSQSDSVVYGIKVTGANSMLESCSSNQNDGGAGTAYGLRLEGDNSYTTGVKTLKNHCSNSIGDGLGLDDTSAGSVHDASNVSAANSTTD